MKHFPGAGPQMEGKDTSPIISSEETLQIHLKPYYAALEVNVASIMPYYSVPLALDMENSAIGSKAPCRICCGMKWALPGLSRPTGV